MTVCPYCKYEKGALEYTVEYGPVCCRCRSMFDAASTARCSICGNPIGSVFHITTSTGRTYCEVCLFRAMDERRRRNGEAE